MTDSYAVMGNPVAHSRSPEIHHAFAARTGQDIHYERLLVEIGGFADAVDRFRADGGMGLNVTVPFKQAAFAHADVLTERAQSAGAVNTLWFSDAGVQGDNTDGVGLVQDMIGNLGWNLRGKRVLILGAGGAAKGILGPIDAEQPGALVLVNRTVEKALELVRSYAGRASGCGYEDLTGQVFDIVINSTSASLGGEIPPLPTSVLAESALCYDLMYANEPTVFMCWATQQGAAQSVDGLGMLVEQAAESFYLWRGVRPDTAPVIEQLRTGI